MILNIRDEITWCSSPCSSEDEAWWNVDNVEQIFPCFQQSLSFVSPIQLSHSEFQEETLTLNSFANSLSGMVSFDVESEDEENIEILTMSESGSQSNESVELETKNDNLCTKIIFDNSDDGDDDVANQDIFNIPQSSTDEDSGSDTDQNDRNPYFQFLNQTAVDREITPAFDQAEMKDTDGSSADNSLEILNSFMDPTLFKIDDMDPFATSSNDLLTIMPRTASPTTSDSESSVDYYHQNRFVSFCEDEEDGDEDDDDDDDDEKESDATKQSNSCEDKCNEKLESAPIEADDSMTKKDKRKIKFNDKNIKFMETYSSDEYERGDNLMDEQKALFEMNFEKKLEGMDTVEVTITKGPSGFGFQTSGNLIPSKNGSWMTLSIRSVVPGSPADLCQQIKPGDIILAINGNDMLFVDRTAAKAVMQKFDNQVKLLLAREKTVSTSDDDNDTFDPDIDKLLESSNDES